MFTIHSQHVLDECEYISVKMATKKHHFNIKKLTYTIYKELKKQTQGLASRGVA